MNLEKVTGREALQLTGKTLVFEGIQGSGKTTLIKELGMLFGQNVPIQPVNVRAVRETILSRYEQELNRGIHEFIASGDMREATIAVINKTMLVRKQLRELYPKANSVYFEDRSIDTSFIYDTFEEYHSEIAQTRGETTRWDDLAVDLQQSIADSLRDKIQIALEMDYEFPDVTFFLYCVDQNVARKRDQGESVDLYIIQDLYQQYYAIREELVSQAKVYSIQTDIATIEEVTAMVKTKINQ